MTTGLHIFAESDNEDLAGSNVVTLFRPAREPMLLGDILAGIVIPDLAVRMQGQFFLPRVIARAPAGRSNRRPRY